MIVLDCNAALAMAAESEDGQALALLSLEGEKMVSPDVIYAEMAHALVKYVRAGYLSADGATKLGEQALALVDEVISSSQFWAEATKESIHLNHSTYDLLYLVLARRHAATLFTLDRKLQKLCLDTGVNCVFTDTEF